MQVIGRAVKTAKLVGWVPALLVLVLGTCCLSVAGCQDDDGCTTSDVLGCAERLVVPDSGMVGTDFQAEVAGTIGPTLCYAFGHIESRWVDVSHVELRPRGTVRTCKGTTCPAAPREFDEVVAVTPQATGWLYVEAISDCRSLMDSVFVSPSGNRAGHR
jgi:hypothetical protein